MRMDIINMILIIVGALNMVRNIYRYFVFLRSSQDVLSSDSKRDDFWMKLAFILLVFFLIGYLFVGFFSDPDLMMACIL